MINTNSSHTKCPKCEQTKFEMVKDIPEGSGYQYAYLRCKNCKTFLAILDYLPIGEMLTRIADKIGIKM